MLLKANNIFLTLLRMGFLGLLTDGGEPKWLKSVSHISCNDETWHSYTLPKEDPKNI